MSFIFPNLEVNNIILFNCVHIPSSYYSTFIPSSLACWSVVTNQGLLVLFLDQYLMAPPTIIVPQEFVHEGCISNLQSHAAKTIKAIFCHVSTPIECSCLNAIPIQTNFRCLQGVVVCMSITLSLVTL